MTQASVLVVEDDPTLREALCDTLDMAGYPALSAEDGRVALRLLGNSEIGLVISDVQLPELDGHGLLQRIRAARPHLPVILMTAYGSVEKAVDAMRTGATDYLQKPFESSVLVDMVARYLPAGEESGDFVAEDEATRRLLALADRVADSDATVMITGESGTGKEVLARYLHQNSGRADGPFVAINCAAIPENMLEAVLFGYEKGAFTGAYQARPGKFEQADGGTLLLDEISEMDLGLQAKLLRVLQEREVERLGGKQPIALDVRVLATSNRSMRAEVDEGRFREDLFYRLNVFPLQLAPLRERRLDILPIARKLLERHRPEGRPLPVLSDEAQQRLLTYGWPGNVRELENVLQRALILMNSDTIEADDLHFEENAPLAESGPVAQDSVTANADRLEQDLRSREHALILDALAAGNGSRKAAAERLGISPRTLRYKLARMREAGIAVPN